MSDRYHDFVKRLTPKQAQFYHDYCEFLDAVKAKEWDKARAVAIRMNRLDIYDAAKRLDEMCPEWYNQA